MDTPFLFRFFHERSNARETKEGEQLSHSEFKTPAGWDTPLARNYNLFQKFALPSQASSSLLELLGNRSSAKEKVLQNTPNISSLSHIFRAGYGKLPENGNRRSVPSAGSFYPLSIYLICNKQVGPLPVATYHYNVEHSLELVRTHDDTFQFSSFTEHQPWLNDTYALIVITATFEHVIEKYGERGYRHCLVEAGHVAQNMILAGVEQQLALCPIGGVREPIIEQHLGINTSCERVIYALYI